MNQCSFCHFYRTDPHNLKQGTCRYNPPTPSAILAPNGQVMTLGTFPPIKETDWCGRWSIKPETFQ